MLPLDISASPKKPKVLVSGIVLLVQVKFSHYLGAIFRETWIVDSIFLQRIGREVAMQWHVSVELHRLPPRAVLLIKLVQ